VGGWFDGMRLLSMRVGTFEWQEKQNGWMVVERIDVPHYRFPRYHTHNYAREGSRSDAMPKNEAPDANARRLGPCPKNAQCKHPSSGTIGHSDETPKRPGAHETAN